MNWQQEETYEEWKNNFEADQQREKGQRRKAAQNPYSLEAFRAKSLKDLEALKPSVEARLQEFINALNVEQTITYNKALKALNQAIREKEGTNHDL